MLGYREWNFNKINGNLCCCTHCWSSTLIFDSQYLLFILLVQILCTFTLKSVPVSSLAAFPWLYQTVSHLQTARVPEILYPQANLVDDELVWKCEGPTPLPRVLPQIETNFEAWFMLTQPHHLGTILKLSCLDFAWNLSLTWLLLLFYYIFWVLLGSLS